ncbi:MAG: hypothetical protein A2381_11535 [Bdellovibrionales bacterium RIFOXYB1_FULL_37_110]|nr:MAG: hypothetical protein A2417_11840 [Bdellovibrionales bacterium RIFOXYC1_FULL_37_79]OFZ57322.1 MAG: hypothetical protein A2381_11535 [Bdellovibrionales bacterium RIFOXYB1_FULL_37_110]OFZ62218.1 MAG: hypothetical protein A2577_14085 [Bdellovibrionales bacterium RIFOXYD1_FULL_36_51]
MKQKHNLKRRKETLDHLSRIVGQIEGLKRMFEENEECIKIASLTTSIAKSFDSLRLRTLEGFVVHQLLGNKSISKEKLKQFQDLLKLQRK